MNVDPKRARKLVRNFERAVRDHEMAGAQHSQDRPIIEENYKDAKLALLNGLNPGVAWGVE